LAWSKERSKEYAWWETSQGKGVWAVWPSNCFGDGRTWEWLLGIDRKTATLSKFLEARGGEPTGEGGTLRSPRETPSWNTYY